MEIVLTEAEQKVDLEELLRNVETSKMAPGLSLTSRVALEIIGSVARIALHDRQCAVMAGKIAERQRDEKLQAQGERDKLAAEVEDWSFTTATPFDEALREVAVRHATKMALRPGGERSDGDPFLHIKLSRKHGLPLDAFPTVEIENGLGDIGLDPRASWCGIAHAAVLAMSYFPVWNAGDVASLPNEDGDCENKEVEKAS